MGKRNHLLAFPEELDLFVEPPKQTAIEKNIETFERPVGLLSTDHPINFEFTTPRNQFVRLQDMKLYLKYMLKLKKTVTGANNTTTVSYTTDDTDWAKVTPTKYLMHSLFKKVSLYINGVDATPSSSNYNYKACLMNTLGFSDVADRCNLKLEGSNSTTTKVIRRKENADTAYFDLIGLPRIDIAYQPKALLGGCRLKLEFIPAPQTFVFKNTGDDLELELTLLDAHLKVNRSLISEACLDGIYKGLQQGPARYPFVMAECKDFTIPENVSSYQIDNVTMGPLPRRMFVCLEKNSTYNGDKKNDSYNFAPNNINYLSCFYGGQQYPAIAYQPNFDLDLYGRELNGLYEALNEDKSIIPSLNITQERFKKDSCIFGFNFAPDLSNGSCGYEHVCDMKDGALNIKFGFTTPNSSAMTAIVLLEYDHMMLMDENLRVELEHA